MDVEGAQYDAPMFVNPEASGFRAYLSIGIELADCSGM
jgi:hypothetical protein